MKTLLRISSLVAVLSCVMFNVVVVRAWINDFPQGWEMPLAIMGTACSVVMTFIALFFAVEAWKLKG